MKFYSSEVMRQHAQDLTNELKVKQIEESLRYFIVNVNSNKTIFPMHDLASKIAKEWPAVGLLDQHDIAQEFYCALVRAYNRVKWSVINDANNPEAALWAYLKKSIKLDVRQAVNTFKDGMRIPHYKLWEAKKRDNVYLDDFFSIPMPNMWFWENDEELNLIDNSRLSSWQTEELYEALDSVMRVDLSTIERQVLEMSYGIDQPYDEKRSVKFIANYFNLSEIGIKKIKARALMKLKTDTNQEYLIDFIES